MSFVGDAAVDQASKYVNSAGGDVQTATKASSVTSVSAVVPDSTHASTGTSDLDPNGRRVTCDNNSGLDNFQPNQPLSMKCTPIENIEITGIDWRVEVNGKPISLVSHPGTAHSSLQEIGEGFTSKFTTSISTTRTALIKHLVTPMSDPSSFRVDLTFDDFGTGGKQVDHQAQLMFIRTNWTQGGNRGYTNSFTFVVADYDHQDQAGNALRMDNGIAYKDASYDKDSSAAGDIPKTATASSATGGHTAAQPTSISEPSNGGHKGLSTGAIAGIAVGGAVVFLGIVGTLIWFLVKRKKQKKAPAPYSDETKATAFLHDKDGAHHTDSVIAPYSDDGHNRRSSAPPQQPQTVENEQRALSPPAVRSSGPGVSSSVAHLVEEGMTEADIRRLEEEERHLDAEIERNAKSKSP